VPARCPGSGLGVFYADGRGYGCSCAGRRLRRCGMAIGYMNIKILDRIDRIHHNVESCRSCQKVKSRLVRDLHIKPL